MNAIEQANGERLETLNRSYVQARARYEGKVALLRLAVLLPFFLAALGAFQFTRNRRPVLYPHANAALIVAALLLLRASSEYVWRARHYYVALVLAVVALGSVLWLLLRRHGDPDRLRKLRAGRGECPACELLVAPVPSLPPQSDHCPRCGLLLRIACPSCETPSAAYFDFCPACGSRRSSSPAVG
jgi:hypothetical protein